MNDNIISVDNISKRFGELEAVKDVSFYVRRGELFGFLGPNGAGKSTTITMLCTMLKPTSGTAAIAGHDIVSDQQKVRESIGIIFQENTLDEKLTAYENLMLHCRFYSVPRKEREARIEEVLSMVELLEKRDTIVETFSGGMKRRLEIARGLLHYPRVLFLDEPTVGLDPQTRAHIWQYINKLREREGITIFLTTHYMDEAEQSDRVAIMDHGTIIALGTPDELKSQIGGDVIELATEEMERSVSYVKESYGLEAREKNGSLCLNVTNGNEFLVRFVKDFPYHIKNINLHRPTLNDVFLNLTGREIRDTGAQTAPAFKQRRFGRH